LKRTVRAKSVNFSGGWALLARVREMWAAWSDQTIHLLIEKGIADPDLLVVTSQSTLPDGSQVGKLCAESYKEAYKHRDTIKAELEPWNVPGILVRNWS
jgi:hypothetical protein